MKSIEMPSMCGVRLLLAFEAAERAKDPSPGTRGSPLIVGGGPPASNWPAPSPNARHA